MKKVNVRDAVGMELCHDVTEMRDGFKGPAFKRGHIIEQKDIEKLLDIGKKTIFVWEPGAGEIHEEEAALRMASMAETEGAHYNGPSEGKMVLISDTEGLFRLDRNILQEVNDIDDITITALPDHYPVKKGSKLASMRIVPLTTKETNIACAEELCHKAEEEGRTFFRVMPYRYLKAGVIITGSEIYSGRIRDKFEPVVRKKLDAYPGEILGVSICDDDIGMITSAAREYLAKGADFLIFTGGMSVDPDDLTPTAIKELGAEIVTQGVPAQPGNMTLIAYLGNIPIIGVPGAAISLPTTVFDVLLPAIYAGEKLSRKDLFRLAEGGACQNCPDCHFPNCTFGRY